MIVYLIKIRFTHRTSPSIEIYEMTRNDDDIIWESQTDCMTVHFSNSILHPLVTLLQ